MAQAQAQTQVSADAAPLEPQSSDLNGLWQGKFSYFASEDIGEWPFKARLVTTGNKLSGIVIELHAHGNKDVKAQITGTIEGVMVTFSKYYRDDGETYEREILYDGRLSPDRQTISGTWRHSESSGPFEMTLVR